jgi:hypothetical protein
MDDILVDSLKTVVSPQQNTQNFNSRKESPKGNLWMIF